MTVQPNERPDPNQLLLTGGKAPESADFGPNPPSTVAGTLLSGPTSYHAREFDKNNPGQGPLRYWPDGNPVYGVYLDMDIPGLGLRRLYVEKLRMTTAIQQAMLRAGVRKVTAGGFLSVIWTGTEAGAGNLPANTYHAEYRPDGGASSGDAVLAIGHAAYGTPPAQPQWQPQTPVPAMAGYAAPPPIANYVPAGMFTPQQPVAAPVPAQPQPSAPQQPQPATAAPVPAQHVLTETIAAAMRNAGILTDGYTIVPG